MRMKFQALHSDPLKTETPCLVVGVYENDEPGAVASALDAASGGVLRRLLASKDFSAKLGRTHMLIGAPGVQAQRVLLVGLGDPSKLDALKLQKAATDAGRVLNSGPFERASSTLSLEAINNRSPAWCARMVATATAWACYRYSATVKPKPETPLTQLDVFGGPDIQAALRQADAIAQGVFLARELGNLPPNICNPQYLAEIGLNLAKENACVRCEVLEREDMEKLGMGSLLAVSRGSANPPKLIVMHYQGSAAEKPYVLVGKGITFDTGGISLKEAGQMDEMKFDMCGAASVFGTIKALSVLKPKINVVGIAVAVENMPDGNSYRPGDVLTSMSGQTIEVLNTDAEGRLILCDALTYAERLEPQALIDIATLTGACVVALGKVPSGLMSKHDDLAAELLNAGDNAGDRAWRLPLWDDYSVLIDSPYADMANIGGKYGGAITAGMFLARFTDKQRWAHLDIAGTAWEDRGKGGATGRPVPLLMQYLLDRAG